VALSTAVAVTPNPSRGAQNEIGRITNLFIKNAKPERTDIFAAAFATRATSALTSIRV